MWESDREMRSAEAERRKASKKRMEKYREADGTEVEENQVGRGYGEDINGSALL